MAPVWRSRVTMPRALPSMTTRSSISLRGCIVTVPAAICRSRAWYAAAGVEGPLDLDAAEGAGLEQATVVASEGHPLRDALVDDIHADLREPVGVGLASAEVAALHGVVEEAEDTVAVVPVVLGRVHPALGRDGMSAARGVVEREALHVVALLAERGR